MLERKVAAGRQTNAERRKMPSAVNEERLSSDEARCSFDADPRTGQGSVVPDAH